MSSELLFAIEQAAVRGWPALETDDANGWLWRYTSGGSIRANTVATLGYHWTDLETAIAYCEKLYAEKGAPCVFTVSEVSLPPELDAALEARGYQRGYDHVTMAKTVDPDATMPENVSVGVQPTRGWMDAYLSGLSADRREAAPRLIANLPPSAVFVSADRDGVALASGLTVVDGTLASVQCMATLPAARRQGYGQRVLRGIEAIAAQNRVRHLYLQTGGGNIAAQRLYAGCGFDIVGRYHTRSR
jgi:N-acetylglutamate synthase